MKKFSVLILALFIFSFVFAEADYIHSPNNMKLPVAATDDIFSGKTNPAAAAFDNADGLGFMRNFKDSDDFFGKNYSIVVGGDLGFVYDRYNSSNYYKLYLGTEVFDNFYLGANWDWKDHTFDTGNFGASMLYRPVNSLSVGLVYNKKLVSTATSMIEKQIYTAGIAIRPLYFSDKFHNRLTLTADADIYSGEMKSPTIGISTEFLDGYFLGGYADLEEETFGIRLSSTFGNAKSGASTNFNMNDDDATGKEAGFTEGYYHTQINDKVFRAFMPKFGLKKYYELNLNKAVVDKRSGIKIGPITLSLDKQMELQELLSILKTIELDKSYDGIIVKPVGFGTNLANYMEIRDAFLSLKKSGKKVIFYFENVGNFNYAFAAAVADKIYMNPNGMADIKGFAATMPYIKGLLDTLGIDVVNLRSHKYKTAMNMFSETEMTPTEREALEYIFNGITDEYKKLITDGRGDKLTESIDAIVENGPYFDAKVLVAKGLVDGLVYENDLKDEIKEMEGTTVLYMNDIKRINYNYDWKKPTTANVAVIYAEGNIHSGKSQVGKSIGSKTYADAIEAARKNKNIDAIILRVNSGGGGAIASDIIAHEIKKCTTGENKKPVIASMGGYAASGGYFISCHADKIYADPTTITGSIGVVGMMMSGEELLKKIKVNFSTVKTSKYADLGSFTRKMTDEEKEMMENYIHISYDSFIGNVAEGRGMSKEEVHKVAQGRVWTGTQAKERGLIDELGSLEDAKEDLRKQLGVEKLNIREYPKSENVLTINMDGSLVSLGVENYLPEELVEHLEQFKQLANVKEERVLYLLPYLLNQNYE